VHHVDLDETADIRVERGHEKVNVMEIVKLPALRDQRVAQDVLERGRVPVQFWRQVSDLGQLERRPEQPGWCWSRLCGFLILHRRCQSALLGRRADGVCEGRRRRLPTRLVVAIAIG
jgi:hypothetical protein